MTTSTHLRVTAIGLIAGTLSLGVGDSLRRLVDHSANSDSQLTAAAAAHPGLWLAAALLEVLTALLLIPGVAALVTTTRGRGSTLTTVGGYLLGIGLVASVGHAVGYYGSFAVWSRAHLSTSTQTALYGAAEGDPLQSVLIALFMIGLLIGTVLFLIGLRRAGRIPVWSVVAGVGFIVLGNTTSVAMGLLQIVAVLLAFVPAGVSLMRGNHPGVEVQHDAETTAPEPALA